MKRDLNSVILTPKEHQIMKELWKLGGATARTIYNSLSREKVSSYFSVITTMKNLERKGLLVHSKQGQAYYYSPVLTSRQATVNHLRKLINGYFDGDKMKLIEWLSENILTDEDRAAAENTIIKYDLYSMKPIPAWKSGTGRSMLH